MVKRLGREEENALVAVAAAGDSDAQAKLLTAHDRMVWKVAAAHAVRWKRADVEDLHQGGCIGLLTAIFKFDASRGCRFITYATQWIKNGVKIEARKSELIHIPIYLDRRKAHKHIKDANAAHRIISIDDGCDDDDDDAMHPVDFLASKNLEGIAEDELMQLHKALDNLDPRLAYVLKHRFFSEESLRTVGWELGLTRERVRQLQEMALVQLKEMLI